MQKVMSYNIYLVLVISTLLIKLTVQDAADLKKGLLLFQNYITDECSKLNREMKSQSQMLEEIYDNCQDKEIVDFVDNLQYANTPVMRWMVQKYCSGDMTILNKIKYIKNATEKEIDETEKEFKIMFNETSDDMWNNNVKIGNYLRKLYSVKVTCQHQEVPYKLNAQEKRVQEKRVQLKKKFWEIGNLTVDECSKLIRVLKSQAEMLEEIYDHCEDEEVIRFAESQYPTNSKITKEVITGFCTLVLNIPNKYENINELSEKEIDEAEEVIKKSFEEFLYYTWNSNVEIGNSLRKLYSVKFTCQIPEEQPTQLFINDAAQLKNDINELIDELKNETSTFKTSFRNTKFLMEELHQKCIDNKIIDNAENIYKDFKLYSGKSLKELMEQKKYLQLSLNQIDNESEGEIEKMEKKLPKIKEEIANKIGKIENDSNNYFTEIDNLLRSCENSSNVMFDEEN